MTQEPTSPPVYRQRFTTTGYVGAAISALAPMALGAALTARHPEAALVAILAAACILGPILVLIGREHYPFVPPAAAPDRPLDPKPWLKGSGEP